MQAALENLEQSARKGNPKASARLEKIFKLLHPGKAGRPMGSTKNFTAPGLDIGENERRALWGPDFDGPPGSAWAHQFWIDRNPSKIALEGNAAARKMSPADLLLEMRAQPPGEWHIAELVAAVDRRDAGFFEAAGRCLSQIKSDGTIRAHSPHRAAVLQFVDWRKKYTLMFLMDNVPWRESVNCGCPSARELKRICVELGVPMQGGRPRN